MENRSWGEIDCKGEGLPNLPSYRVMAAYPPVLWFSSGHSGAHLIGLQVSRTVGGMSHYAFMHSASEAV